jgi:hypothetical protein
MQRVQNEEVFFFPLDKSKKATENGKNIFLLGAFTVEKEKKNVQSMGQFNQVNKQDIQQIR